MPGKTRVDASTPEDKRRKLVGVLVFKERTRCREQQLEFAARIGASTSTISGIENGTKKVGRRKLEQIAVALEWGSFLDYVLAGDVVGASDTEIGDVDPQIRRYAVRELGEIASPTGHVA